MRVQLGLKETRDQRELRDNEGRADLLGPQVGQDSREPVDPQGSLELVDRPVQLERKDPRVRQEAEVKTAPLVSRVSPEPQGQEDKLVIQVLKGLLGPLGQTVKLLVRLGRWGQLVL